MLRRKYPPNEGLWNGVGGKIEAGESPAECIAREVMEEANVDVSEAIRYAGIVSWNAGADPTSASRGMHAFVADVGRTNADGALGGELEIPEGFLAWKSLSWMCDAENESVVSNIPYFLPAMLGSECPMEYRCEYEDGHLVGVGSKPLASRI